MARNLIAPSPPGQAWRRRSGWSALGAAALAVVLAVPLPAASADASFGGAAVSAPLDPGLADASAFAAWVITSNDHQDLPFLVIDKNSATVRAYDGAGALLGGVPVLLGAARGDVSPPGIGHQALATIRPDQRITPAGRFRAVQGRNLAGKAVLWIDYEEALSLHPVVTAKAAERRLQRLESPTPLDNRISYGCVNVPARFYEMVVGPLFGTGPGIVYILPEERTLAEVFLTPGASEASGQGAAWVGSSR